MESFRRLRYSGVIPAIHGAGPDLYLRWWRGRTHGWQGRLLASTFRLHDCELEHRQHDGGDRYGRPLARGNRWHRSPHLQQLHQHGRRVTYLGHGHLLYEFDGFHLSRNRRERLAWRFAYGS